MPAEKDRNPHKHISARMLVELHDGRVFEAVLREISPSETFLRFDETWIRRDEVKDFELLPARRTPADASPFPPR